MSHWTSILSLASLNSVKKKESGNISVVKMSKKGDFENPKVPNHDFSTKSVFN